jgi:hypothetical protein
MVEFEVFIQFTDAFREFSAGPGFVNQTIAHQKMAVTQFFDRIDRFTTRSGLDSVRTLKRGEIYAPVRPFARSDAIRQAGNRF